MIWAKRFWIAWRKKNPESVCDAGYIIERGLTVLPAIHKYKKYFQLITHDSLSAGLRNTFRYTWKDLAHLYFWICSWNRVSTLVKTAEESKLACNWSEVVEILYKYHDCFGKYLHFILRCDSSVNMVTPHGRTFSFHKLDEPFRAVLILLGR